MINRDILVCPYCSEKNDGIRGKTIRTYNLKPTSGYKCPSNYSDYLSIFILKGKKDKYASLMIENIFGTRYVDIRFCPFCGRRLQKNAVKRKVDYKL